MSRRIGRQDLFVALLDEGLRSLLSRPAGHRPSPAAGLPENPLDDRERALSARLMRVNRAGEIAAQALYSGQALGARSDATRAHLHKAAGEEIDHLSWCTDRLDELGGRPSLLDPFWYAGSACIGVVAALAGDSVSLGFIAETESQVEAHLRDHLDRLPADDARSRAILERMAEDEAHHGTTAQLAGGQPLPDLVRRSMAVGGQILREFAFRV
jgi:ubiquinone biosynthesis monooxygenase Coq7